MEGLGCGRPEAVSTSASVRERRTLNQARPHPYFQAPHSPHSKRFIVGNQLQRVPILHLCTAISEWARRVPSPRLTSYFFSLSFKQSDAIPFSATMATTEPKVAAKDDAAPLLDVLEEDDEFEEFADPDWDAVVDEAQDEQQWQDDWDDDKADDEFSKHLRQELEKHGG
ncbi:hypothetical protein Naga_100027g21 [Nannochloropsis gaditana]|uniref:Uncharacterized protein n=2 Tax=Monodopsidaceae TaxID=425072 RepID=W7TTR7_9STRA|nr:hypothetical protein Naga_100027g21 [Nannochloropsis gaditana]